jgi:tetratricopeptide (TPR) repeat protein
MKRPDGPARDRIDAWLDRLRLDAGEGPALPIADDAALELVRRARERCEPAPRARLSRLPKWPLIGIGVVVASSAAAAALGELPAWLARVAPSETRAPNVAATSATEKKAPKPARPREVPPRAPVASPVEPPATELARSEPAPAAMPGVSDAARAAEPRAAVAAPKRSAGQGASDARAAAAPTPEVNTERGPPRPVAPDSPRAADLLGVANRARAERHYAAALTTYREVLERYPETRQAQIAAVAAGELELERGNARAAEPLFQHVPPDAELGAEALFGLSEAYRARARVVEERRALERFVQLYPSNPLAAAARQRLSQLEAAMSTRAPR